MNRVATHSLLLPEAGASASGDALVPDWIQLLPAGSFKGRDGRGPYHVRDAAALAASSLQASGGRLPIDENHQIDTGMKSGAAAPARGWIVELQARDGELWGRVEWTPTGRALVEEKAYRGISPAFVHSKGGDVLQVLRAALTNDPNLPIATLHNRQEPEVDLNALRAALGLAEDADEAAIIAAAGTARTAAAAHAQDLRRIAEAARVDNPAEAGADAIVTSLQARGGDDAAELRREVVSLQAQLTELRDGAAHARATEVVDAAIRAGKPLTPKLREIYIARHAKDPKGTEAELAELPSLHTGGLSGRKPGAAGGGDGLADSDRQVVALMGLDPEAFKKAAAAAASKEGA